MTAGWGEKKGAGILSEKGNEAAGKVIKKREHRRFI